MYKNFFVLHQLLSSFHNFFFVISSFSVRSVCFSTRHRARWELKENEKFSNFSRSVLIFIKKKYNGIVNSHSLYSTLLCCAILLNFSESEMKSMAPSHESYTKNIILIFLSFSSYLKY